MRTGFIANAYTLYFAMTTFACYVAKVHCNLRLVDEIEVIDHNDTNVDWSSDEVSYWQSLTFEFLFELLSTLLFLELFELS